MVKPVNRIGSPGLNADTRMACEILCLDALEEEATRMARTATPEAFEQWARKYVRHLPRIDYPRLQRLMR